MNLTDRKPSCFIASPNDDGLRPLIDKIGHKVATPLRSLEPHWWKPPNGQFYWHKTMTDEIRRARLVVAICSDPRYAGGNPNVAFEVGAAHALGKALVLLVEKGFQPASDISTGHYLLFDRTKISDAEFDTKLGDEIDASIRSTPDIPRFFLLKNDELITVLSVIEFWMDIVANLVPLCKKVGTLANMTVGIAYEKPVDEAFETIRNAIDQYCDISVWSTLRDFLQVVNESNKKLNVNLELLELVDLLPRVVRDTTLSSSSNFWSDMTKLLESHSTLQSLNRNMLDPGDTPEEKVRQSRNELLRLEQRAAAILLPSVQCLSALLSKAGFRGGLRREQG